MSVGLESGKFKASDVSYFTVANVLGVVDPLYQHESISNFKMHGRSFNPEVRAESYFHESNPGLLTNSFQTITQELLSSIVIEGYNEPSGISDRLCRTVPASMRNQKIPGVTHLDGPKEVSEGHPYEETGFEDKWVSTRESKKGRILSLGAELLMFDQTGLVNMRARDLGVECRRDKEETVVRGVIDADSGTGIYVYRPSGAGEALYSGANLNLIGTGGVTGFTTAVALEDWTDVDEVLKMRATKVVDDRVDGTPKPIGGLNGPQNILLVPYALRAKAAYITGSMGGEERTNTGARITDRSNPVSGFVGDVLASEYLDAVSAADWYYGDPSRQFVWMEIWPLRTAVQGADSEAAFERDTVLRIKVSYYGGLTARDSVYLTKVKGS